jgi:RNA polymerase sigma-70 factor (ECF subfamily)
VSRASLEDSVRLSFEERALLDRLRSGDERAFETLVERFYRPMIAVAVGYVGSRAVAEEVVQEAWLGILQGLGRFEGRSSLKTWALRIVANIAIRRREREARSIPVSFVDPVSEEPAVPRERFRSDDERYPGHWRSYPTDWRTLPEQRLFSAETVALVQEAIDELPEPQRTVITLRDMAGCTAPEVCEALGVSEGNQRVLLHRARARVRARLERHFDD